jgi:hypothetical protein
MSESISKINQFLAELIHGAKLDMYGAIEIQRSDHSVINIEVTKDSDVCHLYANVVSFHENEDESTFYTALEMNRFGRPLHNCWLALNSETRMLSLCHNLYIPLTDSAFFNQTLDNFMRTLAETKIKFNNQPEAVI